MCWPVAYGQKKRGKRWQVVLLQLLPELSVWKALWHRYLAQTPWQCHHHRKSPTSACGTCISTLARVPRSVGCIKWGWLPSKISVFASKSRRVHESLRCFQILHPRIKSVSDFHANLKLPDILPFSIQHLKVRSARDSGETIEFSHHVNSLRNFILRHLWGTFCDLWVIVAVYRHLHMQWCSEDKVTEHPLFNIIPQNPFAVIEWWLCFISKRENVIGRCAFDISHFQWWIWYL